MDRTKVEAILEICRQTDCWVNIVARRNGKGYEIAGGGHRLAALPEASSGN